jgi:hypothetical protein
MMRLRRLIFAPSSSYINRLKDKRIDLVARIDQSPRASLPLLHINQPRLDFAEGNLVLLKAKFRVRQDAADDRNILPAR